jgi:DNA mismatch repair protein MutS
MEVLEKGGEIIFLKRIKKGPADQSYGIHVAQLAGLPAEVIAHAQKLLQELMTMQMTIENPGEMEAEEEMNQSQLFSATDMVVQELRSLNLNNITPLEALNRIARWQDELNT